MKLGKSAGALAATSIALLMAASGCRSPVEEDSGGARHELSGVYDLTTVVLEYAVPTPCPAAMPTRYCHPSKPASASVLAGTVTVTDVYTDEGRLQLRGGVTITQIDLPDLGSNRKPPLQLGSREPMLTPASGAVFGDFAALDPWNMPYLQLDGQQSAEGVSGRFTWLESWGRYGSSVSGTFTLIRRR